MGQQGANAQVAGLGAVISRAQGADFRQPCVQFLGVNNVAGIGTRDAMKPLKQIPSDQCQVLALLGVVDAQLGQGVPRPCAWQLP